MPLKYREVNNLLSVHAFPIDRPYLVEYILREQSLGVIDVATIAQAILFSLAEEKAGENINPFRETPDILIPICLATAFASDLSPYLQLALQNNSSLEMERVLGYLGDLLHLICLATESWEDVTTMDSRPPGEPAMLIPRSALIVIARVYLSGARSLESGIWSENLFWAVNFRHSGEWLYKFISESQTA